MHPPLHAPHSVRTYVVGLIVVVLVPLLAFSSFLVIRSAEHEQNLMGNAVRDRTHVAAATIESELTAWRARLFIIAGGLSLEPTDLADFQARASDAFPNMSVVLSDPDGREIIDTMVPFGSSLPKSTNLAAIRFVASTQRSHISDMTIDPVTNRPAATINVPVMLGGRLIYVLSLDILPALSGILAQLDLPPGWIATIADRAGTTLGRNVDADRYVGQPGRPSFVTQTLTTTEGWFPGVSREGVPLYNAFDHVRLGRWIILIGIPRDILYQPVQQSTGGLLLLGGATLTLAISLASLIGRRIAAPMTELVPVAEAVGHGEPAGLRLTRLTEANAVGQSLFEAGRRLRQTAAERETAVAALRESEQQYRAVAEDLARVNHERTALLHRTVAAQEDERKRIARELHDGLAQYLTALRLGIDALAQATPQCDRRTDALDGLRSLTGELGRAVNRMAWELRPVPLEELGLQPAVVHYLEEWAERSRIEVDIEVKLGDRQLPLVVEATLFRVLQEATTNVLKHAAADRIGVILEASAHEVCLIVEDNGKGFTTIGSNGTAPGSTGLGLVGMRERLALVRGSLEVESSADSGTTLFVRIPI